MLHINEQVNIMTVIEIKESDNFNCFTLLAMKIMTLLLNSRFSRILVKIKISS